MTTGRINQVAFRATARRWLGERREMESTSTAAPRYTKVDFRLSFREFHRTYNKRCSTSDHRVCRSNTPMGRSCGTWHVFLRLWQTANTSSQPCLGPTSRRSAHRALPDACAVCRHQLSVTHTFPQDGKVLSIESVYLKNTAWTLMYFVTFFMKKVVLSPGHSSNAKYLRNDLYIILISTTNHPLLWHFHLIVINLIMIS